MALRRAWFLKEVRDPVRVPTKEVRERAKGVLVTGLADRAGTRKGQKTGGFRRSI